MQVYKIYQLGLYKKMVQAFLFAHCSTAKICAHRAISPFAEKYGNTILPGRSSPP